MPRHHQPPDPPVLITGAHRSGTTWVGRVLCQSRGLTYIHEPFNASLYPRLLDVRLGGHYTYVCEENEAAFLPSVRALLDYRIPVLGQVREAGSMKNMAKLGREALRYSVRRVRGHRALVKDPIALFGADWLARRFGFQVVVMIRHPAAFASSLKRLRWDFNFGYWQDQPFLMRDYLPDFAGDVGRAVEQVPDRIDQAILLWRALYSVVDRLRDQHPDWMFIRQEDLAATPVEGFEAVFRHLDLVFDEPAAAQVLQFSAPGNAKEVPERDKGPVHRDSRAAAWTWLARLTPEEIARVRLGTADVASRFYSPDEWKRPADLAGA